MSLDLGGAPITDAYFEFSMAGETVRANVTANRVSDAAKVVPATTADISRRETLSVPQQGQPFEHAVFDCLVALKTLTSRYAMYLAEAERQRLFARLDHLLDVKRWYSDDIFPAERSFRDFLKWMVYAVDRDWTSIGVDGRGNIQVAWVRGPNVMTAQFADRVYWTTAVDADGKIQGASGDWDLDYFAHHFHLLIGQIDGA